MYLVKNKTLIKSMVEKAKTIEHTINTSLLEQDEIVNHYNGKKIYVNKTIKHIKQTCTLLSLNLNKSKLSVLTTVDTLLPTAVCTMNWCAKSAAT